MARITTYTTFGGECGDRRAHWANTPCLCDCHYKGNVPCGDGDAESQPRVVRIQRKRPRPH